MTEKRTQIYLPAEQHGALKRLAKKRGVSLAQIVREALTAHMAREPWPVPHRGTKIVDPLGDLIGCARGPGDLAKNHDAYLYGRASERRRK
ncbi:MAG: CopG family transcriptional regulator [Deltaproteobacteria bacterium]|nr:CopG family transcriptional regulator [Deltaproteobacteria bacterium]